LVFVLSGSISNKKEYENRTLSNTMATFTARTFIKHDDYMTPKYAWENIKNYIPTDKIIWEAFYGDGNSGTILKKLGFETIHEPIDFFKNDKGEVIVSNPPFSKIPQILPRLVELQKPFILLMPSSKINTKYFRKLFANQKEPIQLIIPQKRIHFTKLVNGVKPKNWKNACNFDCFYYCWKMKLPRDIIWLNDEECVDKKSIEKKQKTLKSIYNKAIHKVALISKRRKQKVYYINYYNYINHIVDNYIKNVAVEERRGYKINSRWKKINKIIE
jgi:hypothetical protein